MVKLTCSVVTEPELKARNCPGSLTLVCAPIVTWPVSSNVPGYGPLAVPEAVKSRVDVPALSHVACSCEKLPNRLSPCRLGGACATARAQGSQSKRAVARRHTSRAWCAVIDELSIRAAPFQSGLGERAGPVGVAVGGRQRGALRAGGGPCGSASGNDGRQRELAREGWWGSEQTEPPCSMTQKTVGAFGS